MKVIPIILEEVDVSADLGMLNRIDARRDMQNSMQELIAVLQGEDLRLNQAHAPMRFRGRREVVPAVLLP